MVDHDKTPPLKDEIISALRLAAQSVRAGDSKSARAEIAAMIHDAAHHHDHSGALSAVDAEKMEALATKLEGASAIDWKTILAQLLPILLQLLNLQTPNQAPPQPA